MQLEVLKKCLCHFLDARQLPQNDLIAISIPDHNAKQSIIADITSLALSISLKHTHLH